MHSKDNPKVAFAFREKDYSTSSLNETRHNQGFPSSVLVWRIPKDSYGNEMCWSPPDPWNGKGPLPSSQAQSNAPHIIVSSLSLHWLQCTALWLSPDSLRLVELQCSERGSTCAEHHLPPAHPTNSRCAAAGCSQPILPAMRNTGQHFPLQVEARIARHTRRTLGPKFHASINSTVLTQHCAGANTLALD